jgi:hypothetical protein
MARGAGDKRGVRHGARGASDAPGDSRGGDRRGSFQQRFFKTNVPKSGDRGHAQKGIPAVPAKQLKSRDWLRSYPNADGECAAEPATPQAFIVWASRRSSKATSADRSLACARGLPIVAALN